MEEELRRIIKLMEDNYSKCYTDDYLSSSDLLLLIKGVPELIDKYKDLFYQYRLLHLEVARLKDELQEADELTEKYFDVYMSLKSNRTGDKDVK